MLYSHSQCDLRYLIKRREGEGECEAMLLSFMTSATLGQAMPCHLSEKKDVPDLMFFTRNGAV